MSTSADILDFSAAASTPHRATFNGHDRAAPTPLNLDHFTEFMAQRLPWLLPGEAAIDVTTPPVHGLTSIAADPLEEVVALVLMEASPPDPWRYRVRIGVDVGADGKLRLNVGIAGAGLGRRSPSAELMARMRRLYLDLQRLDDDNVALVLPGARVLPTDIGARALPA